MTGAGYSNFSLTDAAEPNSQQVNAGLYSVSETALAAWEQTGAECDQGQTIGHIQVALDTTVHCTITNSKRPIVNVVKKVLDGDPGRFNLGIRNEAGELLTSDDVFTNTGAGYANNGQTDFQYVPVGKVIVKEDGHSPTKLSRATTTTSSARGTAPRRPTHPQIRRATG